VSEDWVVDCINRNAVLDTRGYEIRLGDAPPIPALSVAKTPKILGEAGETKKRSVEGDDPPAKRKILSQDLMDG